MYASENAIPAWRRYLAIARMIVIWRPVRPAREHEAVEAVVLELAAPDAEERLLEELADRARRPRPPQRSPKS